MPISPECKYTEKLNIWDAIKQAQENSGEWVPVVFFRRNHSEMYATLGATELLALLRIAAMWRQSKGAEGPLCS